MLSISSGVQSSILNRSAVAGLVISRSRHSSRVRDMHEKAKSFMIFSPRSGFFM